MPTVKATTTITAAHSKRLVAASTLDGEDPQPDLEVGNFLLRDIEFGQGLPPVAALRQRIHDVSIARRHERARANVSR